MDVELVAKLADLLNEKGLSAVEVSEGDVTISLKKEAAVQMGGTVLSAAVPAVQQQEAEAAPEVVDFNGMQEVKSPMVGVAYLASQPGAEPFVKVGDRVKKGQTLCILEAMKLMNEFTAPEDGEIMDICVEDGQLVEFGQCLFKLF